MVKKSVLERFIQQGGYKVVKRHNGKWKNISDAVRKTGLSRQTIYRLLKAYPEEPSKGLPKYVKELREDEGFKEFKRIFGRHSLFKTWRKYIEKMFLKLGKKAPISWGKPEFEFIWSQQEFIREEAGGFEEHYATCFHNLMRAIGRHELLAQFKGHKLPQGVKRHWFLHDAEIIELIANIQDKETLMFLYGGIAGLGRASAMLNEKFTVEQINFSDRTIQVYEPKMKQFVSKYPPLPFMSLLRSYVDNKGKDEKVFPSSYSTLNKNLGDAGEKAGLKKTVSTHILKHTFVSQGYRHGLSRETVVEMTGTEDRTIKTYYLAKDEKKIRHEMQGLPLSIEPFHDWILRLAPYFEQKYKVLTT